VNLNKIVCLYLALLLSVHAIAQDREVEFKVTKLKAATLSPDSACTVKDGEVLRLSIEGGFSTADIASVKAAGEVSYWGNEIMVRMRAPSKKNYPTLRKIGNRSGDTAALSAHLDTTIIEVHLKPSAHAADTILRKVVYIIPTPLREYRRSGFYVKWNQWKWQAYWYERYKKNAFSRVHHMTREKLLKEMNDEFKYQNYHAVDTGTKKFDSLYATVHIAKKNYRFHLPGNAATPEMLSKIGEMHNGDNVTLRLYWYDADKGRERRVMTYFQISAFNFN